jgi:heme/copper-type cytochrome/quinol oxidase subunit 2
MSWIFPTVIVVVFAVAGYFWVELRDREKRLSDAGYKNPHQGRNRIAILSAAAALLIVVVILQLAAG